MDFNPFGSATVATRSTVEDLLDQVKAGRAFRLLGSDTKDGANSATIRACREGDLSAVHFTASVGNGRGSTRLDLTGDQIAPVSGALRGWDLSEDPASLPPAECVRRTIARESGDDGDVVSFKLSLAKNSRSVRIPVGEWTAFLDFMESVGQWSEAALAHYQAELAKVEKG